MTEKRSSAQQKTQTRNDNNEQPPGQNANGDHSRRFGPNREDCLELVYFLERLASASTRNSNPDEIARLNKMAGDLRHLFDWTFRSRKPEHPVADDPEEAPEIKEFPVDLLAPIQRELVLRTADSIKVHINLPAISELSVISASIGRGLYCQSGPDQIIRGNLFVLGSAISGVGKSEGGRPSLRPYLAINANRINYHKEQQIPSWSSQKRLAEKKLTQIEWKLYGRHKAKLSDQERTKLKQEHKQVVVQIAQLEDDLIPPALFTADCTPEAMAVLLVHNREQLFSYSPDAGKAVKITEGLYSRMKEPEDNLLVHAFSGDPYSVHRVGRPPINLEHPCLTLFWLVQPLILEQILANKHFLEAGLLARLLICDTHMEPQEDNGAWKPIPLSALAQHDNLINSLINYYWDSKTPRQIKVSPEGHALFRDYHNEAVQLCKEKYLQLSSFILRWAEQARRIAIGLHAALHGAESHERPMSLETIRNAIGIARWFSVEQLRLLEIGRQTRLIEQKRELRFLLASCYPNGVTLRMLTKSHGKTEAQIAAVVTAFPSAFEWRDHRPSGGGRPTKVLKLRESE